MQIKEQNTIRKIWTPRMIKIGVVYPNSYRVAMTSLGIQLLYFLFNSWEGFLCERIFKPLNDYIPPYSLENQKSLQDFDILAISCQFEFDYVEAIELLKRGGVNPDVRKRDETDPIILIGGPSVTSNPFSILFAADAFFLGDIEPIAESLREALSNMTKRQKLDAMASIPGFMVYKSHYDPKGEWLGDKIKAIKLKDFKNAFYPLKQIIPENIEGTKNEPIFGKAFYLETDRGCSERCKFCMIGNCRFPQISRTYNQLKKIIDIASENNNFDKVVIYSSATINTGILHKIIDYIVSLEYEVSCSSLRADHITDRLLTSIRRGGQRTITLAPETGNEELRLALNKKMTNDELFLAIKRAWNSGFRQLKLYMIHGFPCEAKSNVSNNIEFINKIRQEYFPTGKITISMNQFIAKAHTPLQFFPMLNIKDTKEQQKEYRKIFRIKNSLITFYKPEYAIIQKILSLGDISEFPLILDVAREGGNTIGNWKRMLKKKQRFLSEESLRHYNISDRLPWDNIKHELSKKYLIAQYQKYKTIVCK